MRTSTDLHELSREGGAASVFSLELATTDFVEGLADATQHSSTTVCEKDQAIDRKSWLQEMYGENNHNLRRHLAGVAMRDEKLSRATEQAFRP